MSKRVFNQIKKTQMFNLLGLEDCPYMTSGKPSDGEVTFVFMKDSRLARVKVIKFHSKWTIGSVEWILNK